MLNSNLSISAHFQAQSALQPNRPAIKSGNRVISYAELDRWSNRLARAILDRIGPGNRPVAILLPHGPLPIVALMATLKAGKIAVPLDASLAGDRARLVLGHSECEAAIVDESTRKLSEELGIRRDLLIQATDDTRLSAAPLPTLPGPDDLAALYYTSGSTGRPKGVMLAHRNMVSNLRVYSGLSGLQPEDRATVLHTFGGSPAAYDSLHGLLHGACLLPYDVRSTGLASLKDWLHSERPTFLQWFPSAFRRFGETLAPDDQFPSLRCLMFASETLTRTEVELYKRHFPPPCRLANRFAATETGTIRTVVLDHATPMDTELAPLGFAPPRTEVVLLRDDGTEAAPGEAGIIRVTSPVVSPGYWRDPELTRAVFAEVPGHPDLRTFTSGDLGRFREDGCLEYLGRRDRQIKIRGYRIEPAEVETVLRELPELSDAAVLVREDPRGEPHLTAYVAARLGQQLQIPQLRALLIGRLPPYLVPTRYVSVDRIPETALGKLDPKSLPEPEWDETELADEELGNTPLETLIVGIWKDVLRVERISRRSDFFSLGGDSLRATLVANRLHGALGVTVTPVMMLQDPTAESLAATLTARHPEAVAGFTAAAKRQPAETAATSTLPPPLSPHLAECIMQSEESAQPLDLPRPSFGAAEAAAEDFGSDTPSFPETTNNELLAGLATLLHRYSDQDRFSLGLLREDHILPLPVDFRDHPPFSAVAEQINLGRLAAATPGGVPISELAALSAPQLAALPSFLQVLVREADGQVPDYPFDLLVTLHPEAGNSSISVRTNSARVDPTLWRRLPGHLATLLRAAVEAPNTPIGELPLLTPEERQQILVEWGRGPVRPAVHECIHTIIERQVAAYPERTALQFEDECLTYAEINRRANRLAHWLRQEGAGPGRRIALLLPQSAAAVVTLLAVLKSGAAYVGLPLDDPSERLRVLLEDTQPLLILTQSQLQSRLPATSLHCFRIDSDAEKLAEQPDENPANLSTPDDDTHILFTSGSTGVPKAVLGMHRNAVDGRDWWDETFPGAGDDTVTCLLTAVSVLPFLLQAFWPLSKGGLLVIANEGTSTDPVRLVELIARYGVTHMASTSSLMRAMLEAAPDLSARLPRLRSWQCGAEVLPPAQALRFHEHLPGRRLVLTYGSTETTAGFTWFDTSGLSAQDVRIPVGIPIRNCQVFVLDRYRQPVPAGVRGEVYVGGDFLVRGYLNRPDLTSDRFVPNPLPEGRSERFYRMGDLGRFLPDGNLELVGRVDHQVKIRGFRVELAEVEAALVRHPSVQEAVVVARPFGDDTRLVAYLTPQPQGSLAPHEVRRFVSTALPNYMVPALFQVLPAFPRLASGKVNRLALPDPDLTRPALAAPFSAPRGEKEARLARIWEELLGLQPVGRDDDFFELGGHSLLGMRVVTRVRECFGAELSAAALFEQRTVAALAALLPDAAAGVRESAIRSPEPAALRLGKPVPLSFAQQRLWFRDQLEQNSSAFNEPTFIRLRGNLDIKCLEQALDEVIRRHAVLRTRYPATAGEPVQEIDAPFHLPLPLTDLTADPEAEASGRLRSLLKVETGTPFQLAFGPILRARLFCLGPAEHLLSLVIHHIATDGWSTNLLLDELRQLYGAFREQRPSPLPEITYQYADFAAWQRDTADFSTELAFWTQQLANAPQLELPLDYPRPMVPRHDGGYVELHLGAELTRAIERVAQEGKATSFMVLLAAFGAVLGRWSGAEDLVLGAPVADRPFPETEALIGIFLNNLSLRIDLSGNPSFRELLSRVRSISVEAYAHQRAPFERVVEALHQERDIARHPVFEVMCNHLSAPQASLEFPELTVSRVPADVSSAKLPMTLYSRYVEGSLTLRLVYQEALFRPERMEALLTQFQHLLTQVVTAPDAALAQLSLLTPEASPLLPDPRHELAAPLLPTVIDELVARATETPDAPAVSWRGRTWSYRDLTTTAERIAVSVTERVTPGTVVAVTGERSFGLVAAMLGALRAGAVLLTLDPALPPARRALMASEAGCGLLVRVGEAMSAGPDGLDVLTLDPLAPAPPTEDTRTGADLPLPERDTAAYVFFTSGSTGNPKAVLGTHVGLAHFVAWQRRTFAVGAGDRCAQLTALSFDVLLRDLFLPLTSGATLCIPEPQDLAEGATVFGWLEREAITTLHAVPSLTRHWLASHAGATALPQLRYLFLAGEPLRDDLIRWWRQVVPGTSQIVNLYGPTETTLAKFYYVVPESVEVGLQPVGEPLPQTQALVLSTAGTRCGPYEPGEIVIRTPYRSRGYLNAAEETDRRFQPNPFRPGADDDLLYYTGDRGYVRSDGALVVQGRIDEQLKIRGVRFEPGEIEAALLRHPAVREAAVDLRKNPLGEALLAAYVVSSIDDDVLFPALRRFLLEYLPAALVPAAFMRLADLPRNANGKLIRANLPEPVSTTGRKAESAVPRDDVERRLVEIWQELLGKRRVGIHDNFFDLGGHSLMAVQLLGKIQRTFGRELPLATLIQAATVAEIAERLRDDAEVPATSVLVPLQPAGSRPALFAVHGIGGGVLCYRDLARLLGEDQPFYALQAPALAGEAPRHLSVAEMAERYVAALRRVQPQGPYYLIGLSFGGNIALEMAQQLVRAGEPVHFLGMLDSKGPGYPQFPGPLARVAAHLQHFIKLPPTGRRHYLAVRLQGARDLARRNLLRRWFQRARTTGGALPHVLDDIGISHIQAAREYQRAPYPGTITLFQASLQPIGCIPAWDNGWSQVAQEGVKVYDVPGEHAEIVEQPYVQVLAERLQGALQSIKRADDR